MQRSQDKFIVL